MGITGNHHWTVKLQQAKGKVGWLHLNDYFQVTVCTITATQVQLQIEYNPFNGEWTTTPLDQLAEKLAATTLS